MLVMILIAGVPAAAVLDSAGIWGLGRESMKEDLGFFHSFNKNLVDEIRIIGSVCNQCWVNVSRVLD
jgi:hypothetical protein